MWLNFESQERKLLKWRKTIKHIKEVYMTWCELTMRWQLNGGGIHQTELQHLFNVNRIWTFKVRMCVPINEIQSGNWDEIELLTSPREIEWPLCVVKLNKFLINLNEINFKWNDMKWNWKLKEWKWTMRAEKWQKSRKHERLFMNLNAILMKLGGKTYSLLAPPLICLTLFMYKCTLQLSNNDLFYTFIWTLHQSWMSSVVLNCGFLWEVDYVPCRKNHGSHINW